MIDTLRHAGLAGLSFWSFTLHGLGFRFSSFSIEFGLTLVMIRLAGESVK